MRFLCGNNLWVIPGAQEIINWVKSGKYNKVLVNKSGSQRIDFDVAK